MKKVIAILLALTVVFALVSCGTEKTPAPSGDNTPKPTQNGQNGGDFPRWTGYDGEDAILSLLQNCRLTAEYGELWDDETEYTKVAVYEQMCCLDYYYVRAFSPYGYERWRMGDPEYAEPDLHYAAIVDGDRLTIYDFAKNVVASGEAADPETASAWALFGTGDHIGKVQAYYRQDSYAENGSPEFGITHSVRENGQLEIAGRTCKGLAFVETLTYEGEQFDYYNAKFYYDEDTHFVLRYDEWEDAPYDEEMSRLCFTNAEFNCVTVDEMKAKIDEVKSGRTFTEMDLDTYIYGE